MHTSKCTLKCWKKPQKSIGKHLSSGGYPVKPQLAIVNALDTPYIMVDPHTPADSTPPGYLLIDNVILPHITQSPQTLYPCPNTLLSHMTPRPHLPNPYPPSYQQCYANHIHYPTFCTAIGHLPNKSQLQHVQEFRLNQRSEDFGPPKPTNNPPTLMNKPPALQGS